MMFLFHRWDMLFPRKGRCYMIYMMLWKKLKLEQVFIKTGPKNLHSMAACFCLHRGPIKLQDQVKEEAGKFFAAGDVCANLTLHVSKIQYC